MSDQCPRSVFDRFQAALGGDDTLATLRAGLIGKDAMVPGPFGPKPLLYADYVASGRALIQIETFVMNEVLPFYANSHTEASYCGGLMTGLRRAARDKIARICGAGPEHAVVFCGAGATAGINRLVHLLDVAGAAARKERPLVLIGPYEHHSNILPWRESGAEVIALPEATGGGPDMDALRDALAGAVGRPVVGAFSAASNITGECSDVIAVTRVLRAAGARVVWDYAGGGPYLPIALTPAPDAPIDAIVVSAHKFIGGPGASGVLIVRRDAAATARPSSPGGGTVRFVSPATHDYATSLEAREEAGTPNVIGDIRAALAFAVKDAVGTARIKARGDQLRARAQAGWCDTPQIELLGSRNENRLPFFSFRLRDGAGGYVHHQLVTRLLSDLHGIQARGGCACAGPYVHSLLDIDAAASDLLRRAILDGNEVLKPGFVRLNLSYLMTDEEAGRVIAAVLDLAGRAPALACQYGADPADAIFRHRLDP